MVGAELGSNTGALAGRLANIEPAHRVPSAHERRYCDITKEDCPVRVEADYVPEGMTEDFRSRWPELPRQPRAHIGPMPPPGSSSKPGHRTGTTSPCLLHHEGPPRV